MESTNPENSIAGIVNIKDKGMEESCDKVNIKSDDEVYYTKLLVYLYRELREYVGVA